MCELYVHGNYAQLLKNEKTLKIWEKILKIVYSQDGMG